MSRDGFNHVAAPDPAPPLAVVGTADGGAVGSAFEVGHGYLITAWHVVAACQAGGSSASIRLRWLGTDRTALAELVDSERENDLALLRMSTSFISTPPVFASAAPGDDVCITGSGSLADPEHDYEYLSAVGQVQGPALRDGSPLLAAKMSGVAVGMSGSPVWRTSDRSVVGMLTGRYNSADGWGRDTVWIIPGERIQAMLRRLDAELDAPSRSRSTSPGSPSLHSRTSSGVNGVVFRALDEKRPAPIPTTIPHQLPARDPLFLGRVRELREAESVLHDRDIGGGIVCVSGPAGAGKSTLAAHVGHAHDSAFPDGGVYLDLGGFSPDEAPVDPREALSSLLISIGVDPQLIPAELAMRSALWRTTLSNRRLFLLLDNARSYDQIAPLLPGETSSVTFVTSRDRLDELVAIHSARPLHIGELSPKQSAGLLKRVMGGPRCGVSSQRIAELATLCEGLPLALRIVGRRIATFARAEREAVTARLLAELNPLDALTLGRSPSGRGSFSAVLEWSTRLLDGAGRETYEALGIVVGSTVHAQPLAAITGRSVPETRSALEDLASLNLIRRASSGGAFVTYDLIRAHARVHAEAPAKPRLERMIRWYAQTSAAADTAIAAYRTPIPLASTEPVAPRLSFATPSEALDWFDAERPNLVGVVAAAADGGLDGLAYEIATAAWGYYTLRKFRSDWQATHEIALQAAIRLKNLRAECRVRDNLALAYWEQGLLLDAERCLVDAIAKWRSIDDDYGLQASLDSLGLVQRDKGDLVEAERSFASAFHIAARIHDEWGQGRILNHVGHLNQERGDLPAARAAFADAAQLYALPAVNDEIARASSLTMLAVVELALQDPRIAAAHLDEAEEIQQRHGDVFGLACTRAVLAEVIYAEYDRPRAVAQLRRAIRTFPDPHHPAALAADALLAGWQDPNS